MTAMPAMKPPRTYGRRDPSRCLARDVAADLDDDLEGRARRCGEEEHAEQVAASRSRRARRRGSPARRRPERASRAGRTTPGAPSAIGAAMPSPSVTLWIMKPTIRKRAERELAERERRADREPFAEVVQRRSRSRRASPARARRALVAALPRQKRVRDSVSPRQLIATPSSTRPAPPSAAGQRRLQLEAPRRAPRRARNVSRPAVSAMNAASHCGRRAAQRRQPEQPERDRDDADEEADRRRSRGSRWPTAVGVSTAAAISLRRLDPGRARDADRDRLVLDPVVRDDDRARAQPPERRRRRRR